MTYVIHGWFHDKTLYLSRSFSCVLSELSCTQDRQRVKSRFYCRAIKLPAPVIVIAVTNDVSSQGEFMLLFILLLQLGFAFGSTFNTSLKEGKKERSFR